MPETRFAIVGCGRIAERHAQHIQHFGQLKAVCDIAESKAKQMAEAYGAAYYTSLQTLLQNAADFDVVVICTPNALHAPQAIAAMQQGCHVLVEKPMALTAADCLEMIQVSARSGKQLFTVMQNRFNPPVAAVKKALAQGWFGNIYSIQLTCLWNRGNDYYRNSWKGTTELDGGTLFTQFSHFIDLLYWFFGEIQQVQAITRNSAHKEVMAFEDNGVAIVEFENGILGTVHFSVNSFEKNQEGSLTIVGEKGTVKIGGEYLNTIEYQRFEQGSLEYSQETRPANDYGSYKGSMSNHDKVYQSLVDYLEKGIDFYVSPEEGMKTVEIIEKIYLSTANQKLS